MSPEFDRAYFENLYAENADPWGYRTSAYEQAKYAVTIGALPRATYHRALELGCSIGVLTQRLSAICDRLVSVDTSERALRAARQRCPYLHVDFVQAHLPDGDIGAGYDLVVLSEVLYYLNRDGIAELGARLSAAMERHAHILLVHWLGETDYPLSADEAVEALRKVLDPVVIEERRESRYRLDLWSAK